MKGDEKMKENTKFLWMYVGILFSFALILIIFAGLSQSSDSAETKGLENDITALSKTNTELWETNSQLQTQITNLTAENADLKMQNSQLVSAAEAEKLIDEALYSASKAKDVGELRKVKEILAPIDPMALTEAQFYIYNKLVN